MQTDRISGQQLKIARESCGFSQAQAGAQLALWGHILSSHRETIERWESNESTPRANMLPALADLYGVEIGFFFTKPKG